MITIKPTDVAASVVGAFLYAIGQYIYRLAEPKVRAFLTSEQHVAGSWVSKFSEEGTEYSERIQLNQIGRRINGKISWSKNGNTIEYIFSGFIKNRTITALYENINKQAFDQGAFVLEVHNNGDFANGYYIMFSKNDKVISNSIVTTAYAWSRP